MIKKITQSGLSWLWISILILIVDRLTKIWMMTHLALFEPVKILPIFDLTLAYNKGVAFGFLHQAAGWQNWFFGGLAILVSAYVVFWLIKISIRERWMGIALCLILAGALGNAWDRALYGHVVDFLSFHWGSWHFAIFNLADSAICIGAFMMIVTWTFKENKLS